METKERLARVFTALQNVETKGDSTMILADCMRELARILQELPDPQPEEKAK